MTLLNVDNNPTGDINPVVNSVDTVLNPMAHATGGISPRAVGTPTTGSVTLKDSKIVANDGNNNIGLFGFDDAGNMVVKVAKTGYDANSASSSNLIFNSQQDVFKINNRIPTTIPSFTIGTGKTNYALVTVPHGLTFTPLVDVFVNATLINFSTSTFLASSYVRLPIFAAGSSVNVYFFANVGTTAYYPLNIIYGVDATNVYIQASYGSSTVDTTAPISATIFLLQETAN